MNVKDIVNRDLVNLVNCESEPIHIPGSIQPHGFLLAIEEGGGRIVFCSENAGSLLEKPVAEILSSSFSEIFGDGQSADFTRYIAGTMETAYPFVFNAGGISFNTTVHRSGGLVIFEAEPFPDGALSLPNLYSQTGRFVAHMEGAGNLVALCQNIADETRAITGYDRVMIYQFDAEYNGEVIAESRREDLISFARQKYPHTDIPPQARELYIRNQLRMIADVHYKPVPILTLSEEKTNSALDLSISVLRSVSPIHIEYLKNMGVGATLTVSLVLNNKLWGLIACHHYSPKALPHFTRLSALLQGHFLTSQINVREAAEDFKVSQQSETDLKTLINLLGDSEDFIKEQGASAAIMKPTNATGAIIFHNNIIYTSGAVPPEKETRLLIKLLTEKYGHTGFHTCCLTEALPELAYLAETASGVIYHSLSHFSKDCIIWLRKEIVETINWAGNPYSHLEKDDTISRLTPRKSFELWTEEVKYKSRNWKKSELHSAESFAYALEKHLGLLQSRMQEERYRTLSEDLKEANKELANINWISTHDLKEPIRKIQMFASLVLDRDDEEVSEKVRNSVTRMRSAASRMQALIEDILSYSRTNNAEELFAETDLDAVLAETAAELKEETAEANATIHAEKLPLISAVTFQIRQLFVNLLTNALKFSAKERPAEINIFCAKIPAEKTGLAKAIAGTAYYKISLVDNGIGFDPKYSEKIFEVFQRLHSSKEYSGTGIGLAICRKIMENHKGFIDAESAPGKGTTINMYFPVT